MDVSVCFPWRSNGTHRDRLADWISRRWTHFFPEYEQVRGDCGVGAFNRSQAINRAVVASTGSILIIADLDLAFNKSAVEEAVNRVRNEPESWGFGFTEYAKLSKDYTDWLLNVEPFIQFPERTRVIECSESTMSGLVIISRELFDQIGGFNEKFVGWGYEDLAFVAEARVFSEPFRTNARVYHLWHEQSSDDPSKNRRYYEEEYLGLFLPEPNTLPDGQVGIDYGEIQLTINNRKEPVVWSGIDLPLGVYIDDSGIVQGLPRRIEQCRAVVKAVDAEGVPIERPYVITVHRPPYREGIYRVALSSDWDEGFDSLIERLRWVTPLLKEDGVYKTLWFVPPEEPHDYALIFNATTEVKCPLENTYVIIFEPPEILGFDHPWYTENHPQSGANIFMFGTGTMHPSVLGLHLPQATLAEGPDYLPSKKPRRCSMFCSTSSVTPYHKKRREILAALQQTDLDIDFYGRGMPLDPNDPRIKGELGRLKDEGLRPYAFTIDFENSDWSNLTDKFTDPMVNGTVPITNSLGAKQSFPVGSFEYVDFGMTVAEIVGRISSVICQDDFAKYDKPVARGKYDLSCGSKNLCEWLFRKLER